MAGDWAQEEEEAEDSGDWAMSSDDDLWEECELRRLLADALEARRREAAAEEEEEDADKPAQFANAELPSDSEKISGNGSALTMRSLKNFKNQKWFFLNGMD